MEITDKETVAIQHYFPDLYINKERSKFLGELSFNARYDGKQLHLNPSRQKDGEVFHGYYEIEVLLNRLNVYGIEDIKVTPITDLSGNNFVKIEIAGATPSDLKELISEQGKFVAKIGNQTVFIGGKKDITSVSRAGQDVVIETPQKSNGGYATTFRFTVYLSQEIGRAHV